MFNSRTRMQFAPRLKAASIHLSASLLVAGISATLVFLLWYPMPFRDISGGRDLFLLVIAVDVVLGPVITFAIFDRRKPTHELRRDLAVVVAIQLAGLAYGLYTVQIARPTVLALEGSRLRVVRSFELDRAELAQAPQELRQLPLWGVITVATRPPRPEEKLETITLGLSGKDIGMRPSFWLSPSQLDSAMANAAQPLENLLRRQPRHASTIQSAVLATGTPPQHVGFVPILARRTDWSALVDRRDGRIVGYVPVDGF